MHWKWRDIAFLLFFSLFFLFFSFSKPKRLGSFSASLEAIDFDKECKSDLL